MLRKLSWWEKSVILRPFDFAVLGAGLIGKQIAIQLKRKYPSSRVALIDRYPVPYGASTRNAGFACFGSVSEILDDMQRSDSEEVMALLAKRYRGICMLSEEYGAGHIGYRNTGSFEVFTDSSEMETALSAAARINEMIGEATGLKDVFSVSPTSSLHMNVLGHMLYNPYEGMLDSGKLNEAVSDMSHRLGVIPMYGTDVTSFEYTGGGIILKTADGMELETAQLVVANNAFASQLMPELDVEPARGQVIITEELDELPFDGIFHADRGYIYFRNVGKRVLLGGGRNLFRDSETTYDFDGSDEVRNYLEDYLTRVILPGRRVATEMHWSGIMAMGSEKIPVVRRMNAHLTLCVRMSGMGVALGPVLSREVAELM